jgi:hypothetical protein
MKKQEKTHFEDFLKNLFWQKSNTPEIKPDFFSSKITKRNEGVNAFKNILNQIEGGGRKDFDDFSAFLWNKHFIRHKNNFKKTKARNYLNQEFNQHAYIDIFTNKEKNKQIKINVYLSPIIVFSSAIILAILLTASLVRFNPLLAKKLLATTDQLIINPIKISYCAFADDILCEIPIDHVNHLAKLRVDKNLLSSYIVNNQKKLENINSDTAIRVLAAELDGRVAGVVEPKPAEPSQELINLLENKITERPEPSSEKTKFIKKAIEAQKNLVLKIQNKLINIVF